jgi:hypothetical protein
MTAARALAELVAHELVAVEGGPPPRRYRLLAGASSIFDGTGGAGDGAGLLRSPDDLAPDGLE